MAKQKELIDNKKDIISKKNLLCFFIYFDKLK
jgi:hypothetical protein